MGIAELNPSSSTEAPHKPPRVGFAALITTLRQPEPPGRWVELRDTHQTPPFRIPAPHDSSQQTLSARHPHLIACTATTTRQSLDHAFLFKIRQMTCRGRLANADDALIMPRAEAVLQVAAAQHPPQKP